MYFNANRGFYSYEHNAKTHDFVCIQILSQPNENFNAQLTHSQSNHM